MNEAIVTTEVNDNGEMIQIHKYPPSNTSHALQRMITELMHKLIMERGECTLAEIGYLHSSTLMYERSSGNLALKVYFQAKYASRVTKNPVNGKKEVRPIDQLTAFENYLYVGNINDVVSYETVLMPKTKATGDELDRPSIVIKDSNKNYEEITALVLHCNFPLVMAAIHDVSLTDPNYRPTASPISKGKNRDIVTNMSQDQIPVSVTVQYANSDDYGDYNPDDAIPYLTAIAERWKNATKNQEKLKGKVRKEAKKKSQSDEVKAHKAFAKYS